MDRVTEWRGEHAAVVNNHVNYIDLLAQYEDSDLTPAEIGEVKDLIEANKLGRVRVFPVKFGDPIYFVSASWAGGSILKKLPHEIIEIPFDFTMWDFYNWKFVRHHYATKEEAEAAMLEGLSTRYTPYQSHLLK